MCKLLFPDCFSDCRILLRIHLSNQLAENQNKSDQPSSRLASLPKTSFVVLWNYITQSDIARILIKSARSSTSKLMTVYFHKLSGPAGRPALLTSPRGLSNSKACKKTSMTIFRRMKHYLCLAMGSIVRAHLLRQ